MKTPRIPSNIFSRRSFLTPFVERSTNITPEKVVAGSLAPYTKPLDFAAAHHLLRRLTFAPSFKTISSFVGKTAEEAVKILLGNPQDEFQPTPPAWKDSATENPYGADIYTRLAIEGGWKNYYNQLQAWWMNAMRNESTVAVEKLTLFWSSHFTTEFTYDDRYIPPQVLYRQNAMLRRNRLGNFQKFVEDITIDPAMLIYLGGILNKKGRPNENYARELMELYTTGVGHYTEGDVKEAARVLTGWRVGLYTDEPKPNDIYNAYFWPSDHDIEAKQFMGRSIPARDSIANTEYLVKTEEIRQLIAILFDLRKDAIATFIPRKIYQFFFYSNPSILNAEFISECSEVFKSNNFELYPLFTAMFSSEHFFSDLVRGAQIKSPVECITGLSRQLQKNPQNVTSALSSMDQDLIDPPTVQGWEGHHRWITTKTFPNRYNFSKSLIDSLSVDESIVFIKQFDSFEDPVQLVKDIIAVMLPMDISESLRSYLTSDVLLQKQPAYEWTSMIDSKESASRGIKALLLSIIKSPAYQLS